MSSLRRSCLLAVLVTVCLAACGQKGPLYLQTPEQEARQQAQEQQTEQAKTKK